MNTNISQWPRGLFRGFYNGRNEGGVRLLPTKMKKKFTGIAVLISLAGGTAYSMEVQAFTVLDNTAYSDVSIGSGAVKVNYIPARYCNPVTIDSEGKATLPPKNTWISLVNQHDPTPSDSAGYLVLDCEKIYLTGSTATISNRLAILKQLQQWTQEIRPNRILGWYGLVNTSNISTVNPAAAYKGVAELMDLNDGKTAYFPSAYMKKNGTDSLSGKDWKAQLIFNIGSADKADQKSTTGKHPVFPYIWPQYYDLVTELIPATRWQDILNTIHGSTASGLIIWGGQNPAVEYNSSNGGYGPWVDVTKSFISNLN